jgi:hypothetical protein
MYLDFPPVTLVTVIYVSSCPRHGNQNKKHVRRAYHALDAYCALLARLGGGWTTLCP